MNMRIILNRQFIKMSIYSGFPTRQFETSYNKLLLRLLKLLQQHLLQFVNEHIFSQNKVISYSKILVKMKQYEDHKYLPPKFSQVMQPLADLFGLKLSNFDSQSSQQFHNQHKIHHSSHQDIDLYSDHQHPINIKSNQLEENNKFIKTSTNSLKKYRVRAKTNANQAQSKLIFSRRKIQQHSRQIKEIQKSQRSQRKSQHEKFYEKHDKKLNKLNATYNKKVREWTEYHQDVPPYPISSSKQKKQGKFQKKSQEILTMGANKRYKAAVIIKETSQDLLKSGEAKQANKMKQKQNFEQFVEE